MTDGVNGQQHILHSILDLIGGEVATAGESPQIGCDRLEENVIGPLVAFLATRHQRRPVVTSRLIPGCRLPRLFIGRLPSK